MPLPGSAGACDEGSLRCRTGAGAGGTTQHQTASSGWLLAGTAWRLHGAPGRSAGLSSSAIAETEAIYIFSKLVLPVIWQSCERVTMHGGVVLVKYEGLPMLGHHLKWGNEFCCSYNDLNCDI